MKKCMIKKAMFDKKDILFYFFKYFIIYFILYYFIFYFYIFILLIYLFILNFVLKNNLFWTGQLPKSQKQKSHRHYYCHRAENLVWPVELHTLSSETHKPWAQQPQEWWKHSTAVKKK